MEKLSFDAVIKNYQELLLTHKNGPAVAQLSPEGQLSRFMKLAEVGGLERKSVLDIGCGLGDMSSFLHQNFGAVSYTGVDIVPEIILAAKDARPEDQFFCRDILQEPLTDKFDYVMISSIFNNSELPDPMQFIKKMLAAAYASCNVALAFNFISTHVNFRDSRMAYYEPTEILSYCLSTLGKKVVMHHHYEKCDVAVFVYR